MTAALQLGAEATGARTRIGGISLDAEARFGDLSAPGQRSLWGISDLEEEVAADSAQYHDDETDLMQNWNRFYDGKGFYLEPEPLLTKLPEYAEGQAMTGHAVPVYGYAGDNPVNNTDRTGNQVGPPGTSAEGCLFTGDCWICPEGVTPEGLELCPPKRPTCETQPQPRPPDPTPIKPLNPTCGGALKGCLKTFGNWFLPFCVAVYIQCQTLQ